jgi:hypothetical protein
MEAVKRPPPSAPPGVVPEKAEQGAVMAGHKMTIVKIT